MRITSMLILGWALLSDASQAATIYSYQGNTFETDLTSNRPPIGSYSTANSISGWFQVDSQLGPNYLGDPIADGLVSDLEFSDGVLTTTYDDIFARHTVIYESFILQTDPNGKIIYWLIQMDHVYASEAGQEQHYFVTRTIGSVQDAGQPYECSVEGCSSYRIWGEGQVLGKPGSWQSSTSIVPIPTAAWLFASGLGLLGCATRKGTP